MHFLPREIVTETAAVSGVANLSPAPALIKLKKWNACINVLILTPLKCIFFQKGYIKLIKSGCKDFYNVIEEFK